MNPFSRDTRLPLGVVYRGFVSSRDFCAFFLKKGENLAFEKIAKLTLEKLPEFQKEKLENSGF